MKQEDLHEIVEKLIGEIEPLGDSSRDDKRYDSLKMTCALTEHLLDKITSVEKNMISHEFSVKRAGKYASDFLDGIRESLI